MPGAVRVPHADELVSFGGIPGAALVHVHLSQAGGRPVQEGAPPYDARVKRTTNKDWTNSVTASSVAGICLESLA